MICGGGAKLIDRRLLKYAFDKGNFPLFLCPRCSSGYLSPSQDLAVYHPNFSKNWQQDGGWWGDIELRLAAILRCNSQACGEQVLARCEGGIEPDFSQGTEGPLEEYFVVKSISPSPHIINLPESLPKSVRDELVNSFEAFWTNKSLALNAIRNSLEAFLAHFNVPDEIDGKWVSFGNRLRIYAGINADHTEFFSLLKPMMNSGSHGDIVETETILDIYEALEIFLHSVFDDRTRRLNELKEKFRQKKNFEK